MTDASRRTIAVGQIAGATLGVFALRAWLGLSPAGEVSPGVQLLVVLYSLAAIAGGVMLMNRRPLGAWISFLVQAVQVVGVLGTGDRFWFLAGPLIGFRAGGGGLHLELGVGGCAWATVLTGPTNGVPGGYFTIGAGLSPTDPDATALVLNGLAILAAASLLRLLVTDAPDREPVRPAAEGIAATEG